MSQEKMESSILAEFQTEQKEKDNLGKTQIIF